MLLKFPDDILSLILNEYLDNLKDQLNLFSSHNKFKHLKINKLNAIQYKGSVIQNPILTQEIIEQPKFFNLKELNINGNRNISNLNHLTKLTNLHAYHCDLKNFSIEKCLNIKRLNLITNNREVSQVRGCLNYRTLLIDFNFFTNLIELKIMGLYIKKDFIKNCFNLKYLTLTFNPLFNELDIINLLNSIHNSN